MISRTVLFEKYRDYCKDSNMHPVSQKTFNKEIETAYPAIERAVDKVGKVRIWRGIRHGQDD
ncbi:hypothetical protein FACS1894105_05440 [Clostridia bacterium]|nr:hypothetical protein FACS1894105_05440 [Clostridia bacterium]